MTAWAIYNKDGNGGKTLIREEREHLPPGYYFVREATESEVEGELGRRGQNLARLDANNAYRARKDVSTANLVATLIQFDTPEHDLIRNISPAEWETILAKLRGEL